MTPNWQTKKLGSLCNFVRGPFGGSLKKTNFVDDGYAVYEQQHAIYDQFDDIRYFIDDKKFGEMKRFELKPGDLIMSCSGTMGKMAIVPQNIKKGIINQALLKLTPSNQVLIKFLKLWMESEIFQDKLKLYSQGAAIKNVASVKILKDIEISLPSLSEQQRIVKILNETFESIAKAKSIAEKNLQNTRDIFKIYLQNIFEDPKKDWENKKIGEVCFIKSGTTISPKLEKQTGDILYVKVGDMNLYGNEIEINTSSRFINLCDLNKNQIIPCGSIIFPKRGGAIFTNKRRKIIKPTIIDLNTMALIPSDLLTSDFLYYWFLRIDLRQLSNGTSVPQINNYSFDKVFISYPKSLSEQKGITKRIDILSKETKKLESMYQQKLADLEELKKSILNKAFNGEL